MPNQTVQELEAQLAAARDAQRIEDEKAAAAAQLEADEAARRARILSEIADVEAGIAHLESKVAARREIVAALRASLEKGPEG